ncbi:hypothetical protein B7463_g12296, partial [Scytalidium lignicola]
MEMSLLRQLSFSFLAFLLSPPTVKADLGVETQIPFQFSGVTNATNNAINCQRACLLMQDALGQNTASLPDNFNIQYYSAQQRELLPSCIIQPESAEQISRAITIIRETQCIFAIKSGGHGISGGSSNIQDGIVIDLSQLNGIEVSEDESTAFIGTGNKWLDVYLRLEERGLSTVGGRVATVGVGGFTLAGGISFLSRRYGWALDNVRNFEVVLANGSVVNASQTTHPDLYFALRGGGNNFGIVTRFDFEAYQQGELWGGNNVFILSDVEERRVAMELSNEIMWNFHSLASHAVRWIQRAACFAGFCIHSTDLIDYFVQMANQPDPFAHTFVYFSWIPVQRAYLGGTTIAYSKPEVNPPVFQKINSLKSIYSTNRLANMSDFALEVEEQTSAGDRLSWNSATFKVDATLISKLMDIFLSESDPLTKLPGALPSMNLQLITKDEISLFAKNGGNSLGIEVEDGSLFIFSVTMFYKDAKDDELVLRATENIIKRAILIGKEMNLHHRFIYQNYVSYDRGVFAGYGPENRERLLQIQRQYDPEGVFQRLKPGFYLFTDLFPTTTKGKDKPIKNRLDEEGITNEEIKRYLSQDLDDQSCFVIVQIV